MSKARVATNRKGWPLVADFDLDVTQTDAAAVVRVIGELDQATAPRLGEEIIGLVSSGLRTVTVDLAQLDFIDSTGLAVLVSSLKRLREHGGAGASISQPERPEGPGDRRLEHGLRHRLRPDWAFAISHQVRVRAAT